MISRLMKQIIQPVTELGATARAVTAKQNYTLRAQKTTNDELGQLVDCFNEMLVQIQQRDSQLDQHRLFSGKRGGSPYT